MRNRKLGPRSGFGVDSRIVLVGLGVSLGYLARLAFGPPSEENTAPARQFLRPLPITMPTIDIPLDRERATSQTAPPIEQPAEPLR